jgi:4'-phosphopantetheinyl transferase
MTNTFQHQFDFCSVPSPVPDVDLWMTRTDHRAQKVAELAVMLSADERAQGEIRAPRSGYERFVLNRGMLRVILGKYLDIEPGAVEFTYGVNGKPRLAESFTSGNLHFNLSHSGGIALVAVTKDQRVVVDVERMKLRPDFTELSKRVLTNREHEKLTNSMYASQRKIFYRFWVRKESYLKGTGAGLSFPVYDVDVSITSYRTDQPVTIPIVNGQPVPWRIFDLRLPDFGGTAVGALAVEGIANKRNEELADDQRNPVFPCELSTDEVAVE